MNILKKLFSKSDSNPFQHFRMFDLPGAFWSTNKASDYIIEGYKKNVIAYRCIKEIADSLGTLEWNIYNTTNKVVKNHPMLELLKRPNPLLSGSNMIVQLEIYKQTTGNSFLYAVYSDRSQPPKELYVLSPSKIEPIEGKKFFPISGYKYKIHENPDEWKIIPVDQITGKSDLLHFKFFDPLDPLWGQSPIESCSRGVDTHNEASTWNMRLLQNGARPAGGLFVEGSLDDEQREDAKKSWQSVYGGSENAGSTLLMEGGIKWEEMALSPKDMDYLNTKNVSAREIATAFRVPPMLLNITGDNTYDNMREARLSLWEDTLLPEADSLRDELNHWLTPLFGENIRIDYDKNKIPALTTRREKVWYAISSATFLTIDEQREVAGYEPLPDGKGEELAGGSSPQEAPNVNEGDDNDNVDNTQKSVMELKTTQPFEYHSHMFDNEKSGQTTEVNKHTHDYTLGATKTGITNGHSHKL